jgi:hypothetical protein
MMRFVSSPWGKAAVLLSFSALLFASTDADRILEEAVAAHGGLPRFHAVRDWRIVAERKIEDQEGIEIYEEFLLRDGGAARTLLVKKREGSVLVFGHDGRTGFALENGRMRDDEGAAGEGYYRAHGEYYLRALPFKWKDPGMHVEYAGRERKEGRNLDLLRITAGENVGRAWKDVWVAAIDRETHLLWEARLTHHRENQTWMNPPATGTTEITYRYTDYREVAGLRIPHRLEYFSEGRRTGENVIRSIEIDRGLTEERFHPDAHRTEELN